MRYFIPHEQPDGSIKLEEVVIHFWRNPVRWFKELKDSFPSNVTVTSYKAEQEIYERKRAATGDTGNE